MNHTTEKHVTHFHTQHLEDTVFNLKQTIAKHKHELLAKNDIITCLKQDIYDNSRDKQRLDWILEHCDVGDKFYKTSFYNRDEIDQVMEDAQ